MCTCNSGWILGFIFLMGCGDSRPLTYPVQGQVCFEDGTPVRFGIVEFVPEIPGPSARGTIDQQGRFILGTFINEDGAVAGPHRVLIVQHFSNATPGRTQVTHQHENHEDTTIVDLRYSQLDLAPLTATVQEKSNDLKLRVRRADGTTP